VIINVDAKSLEWCTYLFLSQDPIGIEEWRAVVNDPSKHDIHSANQAAFKLPSRLIAKVFLFRWIYRGSAFAYSRDPDFIGVSNRIDFWQDVIDRYYSKYKGILRTHLDYIKQATTTGHIVSPIGRDYFFEPKQNYRGELVWSENDIVNWPNQGLGDDVMAVARVAAASRAKRAKLSGLLINSVHDSIEADIPEKEVEHWHNIFVQVFKDLPNLIKQAYGIEWNVPMVGEVSAGENRANLIELA